MDKRRRIVFIVLSLLVLVAGLLGTLFMPPAVDREAVLPNSAEAIARGEYLVAAGGCISCHQESDGSEVLAGGYVIESDFGSFTTPNITPDPSSGIGGWTAQDFLRALKHGRSPAGGFYYPAFPYRAYAGLSDSDVLDIGAYLTSLEPVENETAEAETPYWLNRYAVAGWNLMADFSEPEPEQFDDQLVERGAYLARSLGHCGECHTPRDGLGLLDYSREYAGAELGDQVIEAIDAEALAGWTFANFDIFLLIGIKPSGEFVGGDMNDVIEHNTSRLTDEDRDALAAFFTRHNQ